MQRLKEKYLEGQKLLALSHALINVFMYCAAFAEDAGQCGEIIPPSRTWLLSTSYPARGLMF